MSGKGRRRGREQALAALLSDDDLSGLTELAEYEPDRVDLVEAPATGSPVLIMKSAAAALAPAGGDAELIGYAQRLAKSSDSAVRRRAEDLLERMGVNPFAAVAKASAAPSGAPDVRLEGRLVKAEPERRFTLLRVYPADRPDRQVAQDQHRDFASFEANEAACWAYMAKSRKIGLWHSPGSETEGAGDVVESFIWRSKTPWVIKAADGSKQVIKRGDWCLGVRWQPQIWEFVKGAAGRGIGVSMQGSAVRRRPSAEAIARLRERGAA